MIKRKFTRTKKSNKVNVIVNKHIHNRHLLIKGVKLLDTTTDIQSDDEYLKEALAELGIDLNKPRKKSRLPKNRLGLPVVRGGAGKDMLTMYREEKGRC